MKPKKISENLFREISRLITETRNQVAVTVNAELVILYWNIGNIIRKEILKEQRAEYGKQVMKSLSDQLTQKYGKGYSKQNLLHFVRFAETFTESEKVYTLCRQFSWSHFRTLIYIDDELKREFYIEMCRLERWSVRALRGRIDSMLFERTAIAKKPDEQIRQELKSLKDEDKLSPDLVFKDPYLLNFLGLKDTFNEKDLESAILHELQSRIVFELPLKIKT